MKRIIKDIIVLMILNATLQTLYTHSTGRHIELFDLAFWSICFISVGLSYVVDDFLEKIFRIKF